MSSIGNGTSVPSRHNMQNSIGGTEVPLPSKYTNLPHIDIEGYYQFITFRTYDSIDLYVKKLAESNLSNDKKQYSIDNYLDNSKDGSYLNGIVLNYLYNFLRSKDQTLYELISFSIMNNHIHLLIKPLDKLSKVMQSIKGITSREINKLLNKSGKFWASNYYDKTIKDEKHFWVVYEYIKNNPLKIGGTEVQLPKRFYGIYE